MRISVIIPVFNTEKYLERCLSSILTQEFEDWECILVDDGSTDRSSRICDEWSERDGRFNVIHQSNLGVSAARNRGIDSATGAYVAFVDSDDVVSPRYLSALADAILSADADLAVCGITINYAGKPSEEKIPPSIKSFSLDSFHIAPFLALERDFLLFGPVGKLYKRQIVLTQSSPFNEQLDYGEDLLFNLEYLIRTQSIAVVSESLYRYEKKEETLSTRFRPDLFNIAYAQWLAVAQFHEKKGLTNEQTDQFLAGRLWGIVYDGIFMFPKIANSSSRYLKRILAIPEITVLKSHKSAFHCAKWIKSWILHRRAIFFFLYFKWVYKR